MNVPSITGKTLGSNLNDYLQVNFWTSAGSDFNARSNSLGLQTIGVDLWGIHIRQGTWTAAATADYRPRDPGTELALCRRYYQTGLMFMQSSMIAGGGSMGTGTMLPVAMRAQPVVTLTAGASASLLTGPVVQNLSNVSVGMNGTFSGASGAFLFATFTADAEL
jgi:hypothetical protein